MIRLNPIEVGRLAIALRNPLRYVQRRVEQLDLVDDHYYRVRVSLQVLVPVHRSGEGPKGPVNALVSLGSYRKARVPDLTVRAPDGTRLAVLNHDDRGDVLGWLFVIPWQQRFFAAIEGGRNNEKGAAIWHLIQRTVADISVAPVDVAIEQTDRLARLLENFSEGASAADVKNAIDAIVNDAEFWSDLDAIARTTVRIAELTATPGHTSVLEIEYTERFDYDLRNDRKRSPVLWVLRQIGWISVSVSRSIANVGRAGSLWVIQSMPEGVEPLRCYWEDRANVAVDLDTIAVECERAVAGRHDDQRQGTRLILDVQLEPSPAMATAAGLAAFLVLVSTYVFRRISNFDVDSGAGPSLVTLAGLFSTVPAALAGGLAYRGAAFSRRLARGPRCLLAFLAVLASLLGVGVGLKGLGRMAEWSALALSGYSFWLFGVFMYIKIGPRWRKNDRSRLRRRTEGATPLECVQNQQQWARWWLLGWTSLTVAFYVFQVVLRHHHAASILANS
jgi:hypothetical protein